jgi:XTP/dITP diphosphohydrolase
MTELWIATENAHKLEELRRLLAGLPLTLRPLGEASRPPKLVEKATDFAGNAAAKAGALAKAVKGFALADDSGLCVHALDNRPGVHSARWAGPKASDEDRIKKLLRELAGLPFERRTAHFTCALCVAGPDGKPVLAFEEHCQGFVLLAPRGERGFGYDPVFLARSYAETARKPSFAELEPEAKDAVSHRGKALRRLRAWLEQQPLAAPAAPPAAPAPAHP